MATENNQNPGSTPIKDAIEATTNWRTYLSASKSEFDLKSFWMSIDTIKSLLEQTPDADGIRIYLGLENAEDPTSFKFVTVSTKDQKDVFELPDGKPCSPPPPPIYCPPYCPTGSPLNG